MAYVIGFLLAVVAIAVLARPILRRGQVAAGSPPLQESLDEVTRRLQQAYANIRSLALDYDLGNVPSEEYEDRLAGYRLQAADLLRQQEQLRRELDGLEDEIEDRVLALRMSWGTVKAKTVCTECGGERDARAVVCPRCEAATEDEPAEGQSPRKETTWAEQ